MRDRQKQVLGWVTTFLRGLRRFSEASHDSHFGTFKQKPYVVIVRIPYKAKPEEQIRLPEVETRCPLC